MVCLAEPRDYEEELRFQRASKVAFSEINIRDHVWFYCEWYERDNGFFMDMKDLVEYCNEHKIPQPIYVWATKLVMIEVDANEILEEALERKDMAERMHLIHPVDIERLQEMLEQWCGERSEELGSYEIDYDLAIIIGE